MFIPDVRSILPAYKQAQELCKPGVLKAVAHHCPNGGLPPTLAAGYFGPLLAAVSVICISGALYLIFVGTMWLCYIHDSTRRNKQIQGLENIAGELEGDEKKRQDRPRVSTEIRSRNRTSQALRRKWTRRVKDS